LSPEVVSRIRQLIASDATAKAYFEDLKKQATSLLDDPLPKRTDNMRLVAFGSHSSIETLALLHVLEPNNQQWIQRGVSELMNLAAFPDWAPSASINLGELSRSVGIGYDWFWDVLSPKQRATIKAGLVKNGLQVASQGIASGASWTKMHNNFNQVTYGGLTVGALAVADEEPALAKSIVLGALKGLPTALAHYAPSGAWYEGPNYWIFATNFFVLASAAMTSALGSDFGLTAYPGISKTGDHFVDLMGPTRSVFNFADAGERSASPTALFFLSRRFNKPLYAAAARTLSKWQAPQALDLVFYDPRGSEQDFAKEPLARLSQGTWADVVTLRSSRTDPKAVFVAFRGGQNGLSHGHLDLGSFVLDADGHRWAHDLGSEDYGVRGYWGTQRFTYYRTQTQGHNAFTFGGANQAVKGSATTDFKAGALGSWGILNLASAYGGQGTVKRGIALLPDHRHVIVQDEYTPTQSVNVLWSLHTQASVSIAGKTATLTEGGSVFEVRVAQPSNATLSVQTVTLAAPQKAAPGTRKLLVTVPNAPAGRAGRITVVMAVGAGSTAGVNALPLVDWATKGPATPRP
jgi:hypothetical protein